MRFLALQGAIARLEGDGSLAVLEVEGDLAGFLAGGGRLDWLERVGVRTRAAPGDRSLASVLEPGDLSPAPVLRPGDLSPAPVLRPGAAIYGIGLNYRSKQEATGRALPDHPTLFAKAAAALAAPGEGVVLPKAAPDCVDYEGEIAVVLGASLRDARPDIAASAVTAVVAANDVTARDVMRETGNPMLAKSFPGFAQLGSAVLDPADYGGFDLLELTTTVNGELRQHDHGAGMLLGVGELLALLSRYVELRPGDVVLTGTPAGTGDETKTYLAAGDVVEVVVADLPPMRTSVSAAAERAAAPETSRERVAARGIASSSSALSRGA